MIKRIVICNINLSDKLIKGRFKKIILFDINFNNLQINYNMQIKCKKTRKMIKLIGFTFYLNVFFVINVYTLLCIYQYIYSFYLDVFSIIINSG